ncbi:MAG: tripartite tricarboxylate transporter TctB family protein [Clostridia bacterium]|nr:tripartite tricarboxylate transporter TctB family protein [Clostridia bacterium]
MSFKKCRDLILGIVMLALSAFYLYFAQQIKTRPKLTPSYASARVLPTLLGILLAILSVALIVLSVKKLKTTEAQETSKGSSREDLISVALTIAVIIAYIFVMDMTGFILATMLYLFCQMMILAPKEKRNPGLFAIVSVIFTVVVFVAFRIGLKQLLPRGIIESLIGF